MFLQVDGRAVHTQGQRWALSLSFVMLLLMRVSVVREAWVLVLEMVRAEPPTHRCRGDH